MPKASPHRHSIIAGIFALIIMASLILVKSAGDSLYDYPKNPDLTLLGRSTLITCLAGGRGRIEAALKIYAEGHGLGLFIAGAGSASTRESILRDYLPDKYREKLTEERKRNIIVETQSRNTIENAYAISRFLRANPEIEVVVLLTSAYHMRRSELILKNTLRSEKLIYPFTPKSTINKGNWIASANGISVTMVEWSKLVLAQMFIPLIEIF